MCIYFSFHIFFDLIKAEIIKVRLCFLFAKILARNLFLWCFVPLVIICYDRSFYQTHNPDFYVECFERNSWRTSWTAFLYPFVMTFELCTIVLRHTVAWLPDDIVLICFKPMVGSGELITWLSRTPFCNLPDYFFLGHLRQHVNATLFNTVDFYSTV